MMIGEGTLQLQYWEGGFWIALDFKYTFKRILAHQQSDSDIDLAGEAYEQVFSKRNQYVFDIYVNEDSTVYPLDFDVYKTHLFDFYTDVRHRIVIDGGSPIEVSVNKQDVIPLEFIEFCDTISTLRLTFIDKTRKTGRWST